ncbi:hypothetical protein U0070_007211 [Myodes glareolus]|uniref:40S ribosomal protein S2 n=1 Tax=Myodes glareolus TaxID=447135 RepID=A0AAW0JS85_MYOGA
MNVTSTKELCLASVSPRPPAAHDVMDMDAALSPQSTNFAKAIFDALSKPYSYLTPDLWKETVFTKSPCQKLNDHLVTRLGVDRSGPGGRSIHSSPNAALQRSQTRLLCPL